MKAKKDFLHKIIDGEDYIILPNTVLTAVNTLDGQRLDKIIGNLQIVSNASDITIDDTILSTERAYSSSKIDELIEKLYQSLTEISAVDGLLFNITEKGILQITPIDDEEQ